MIRFIIVLLVVSALLLPVHRATMQDSTLHFEERTLTYDGLVRRYLLYVPPAADGSSAVPLVFLLHGGGGSPDIYEGVTGMGEVARREGFILVYPAGTGLGGRNDGLLTWNSGYCCGYALRRNVDDVGFFRALVQALTGEFNVDPQRIFVAGHSNGGMMAYRLAAEMSDVFAAAAVVSGTIGGYPTPDSPDLYVIPAPAHPVSILHIHGMADQNVRYEGGVNGDDALSQRRDLSVADAITFWVQADHCATTPTHVSSDGGMLLTDTYACDATGTAVELISIVDGGHSWPGGDAPRLVSDPPSQRLAATEAIWAFFSAHPKR